MNKTIIIIPARMASTRLPGKPLANIGGKPMVVRVVEQAIRANIGPVYVACAEKEIADAVMAIGGHAVLTDPNHASGSDRIWEALEVIDPGRDVEYVVNLQGDLPFIAPDVLELVPSLMADQETAVGTFVAKIIDPAEVVSPHVVKAVLCDLNEVTNQGRVLYFSRAKVPYGADYYYKHIGIYVYKRSALEEFIATAPSDLEKWESLEQLRCYEKNMCIKAAITTHVPLSVDTAEDLELARSMVSEYTPDDKDC